MLATVLCACANSNKQQTSEPSATPEATVQTTEEAAQTDAEEAPDFTLNDINGKPLKGTYLGNDKPMSDGFEANAIYFKLGFLDKNAVALGRQFKELLPVLWMKANCIGPCPNLKSDELPKMLVLPENKFAVLIDETYYSEFDTKLTEHPEIQTIYIITDSESAYREMIRSYEGKDCYQLYRDYLDNFRINTGR